MLAFICLRDAYFWFKLVFVIQCYLYVVKQKTLCDILYLYITNVLHTCKLCLQ
jgi:hypothetical protein